MVVMDWPDSRSALSPIPMSGRSLRSEIWSGQSTVGAEAPDLILLGGDYISESPRYAPETASVLAGLLSDTPLGGYAVIGNHDLAVSRTRVQEALATVGIPLLRNQTTIISFAGSELAIAGIDETLLGDPRPAETIRQAPPGVPVLALWHEPQFAEQAAGLGAFAQLSGHTHGGQIRIPALVRLDCRCTANGM